MDFFFFFQAEDGIRDRDVTGVQTCALPISRPAAEAAGAAAREEPADRHHPPEADHGDRRRAVRRDHARRRDGGDQPAAAPRRGGLMKYARLGTAGVKVSRVCLGMMSYGDRSWRDWVLDEDAGEPIVRKAAEQGVMFFDTADVYSRGVSEEITGRLLARLFPKREDYVLATKVFSPMGPGPNEGGLSRKHILSSIDGSLRRLGTDYVDLYQIHRFDPSTPVEETMEALHDVVRAGKARYIGASSMYAWQFGKAQYTARLHGWT